MLANYHTHTVRCGHAIGSEREYIENAIMADIKILGFSDHGPQIFDDGYVSGIRMTPAEAYGYVKTLRSLGEEYKNDIKIYVGFESEYFPEIFDRMLSFYRELDVDYVILGQHSLTEEKLGYWVTIPESDCNKLRCYVDEVIEGASTGVYSYIAHPDVFKFIGDCDLYYDEMKRLCESAKKLSIPLEVNMLGLAEGRHYPSERFYKIAAEVGNDVIIGCDAHQPQALSDTFWQKKAREFAESFGLHVLDGIKLIKP